MDRRNCVVLVAVLSTLLMGSVGAEESDPWRIERKVDAITDSVTVTLQNFGREWDGIYEKVNIGAMTITCKQGNNGNLVTLSIMSPKLLNVPRVDFPSPPKSNIYFRFGKEKAVLYEGWETVAPAVERVSMECPQRDIAQILDRIYAGYYRTLIVRSDSPFTGLTWTMRFNIEYGAKMVGEMFEQCKQ